MPHQPSQEPLICPIWDPSSTEAKAPSLPAKSGQRPQVCQRGDRSTPAAPKAQVMPIVPVSPVHPGPKTVQRVMRKAPRARPPDKKIKTLRGSDSPLQLPSTVAHARSERCLQYITPLSTVGDPGISPPANEPFVFHLNPCQRRLRRRRLHVAVLQCGQRTAMCKLAYHCYQCKAGIYICIAFRMNQPLLPARRPTRSCSKKRAARIKAGAAQPPNSTAPLQPTPTDTLPEPTLPLAKRSRCG